MSDLPDELWGKILSLGIKNSKFTYKDLCSISLSCKLLYRLSGDDSLWSHLLSSDFPRPISSIHYSFLSSSSPKFQYKIRFKRKRHSEKLLAARRSRFLAFERLLAVALGEVVEPARQLQFSFDSRPDSEIEAQTRAELQKENQIAIISAKIQEIELAQENRKRKPTVAEYFNLPKANSSGFERVPNRCYPREKRSKGFTQQRRTWYQ